MKTMNEILVDRANPIASSGAQDRAPVQAGDRLIRWS
jgi:hypothetical protein